MQNIVRKLCYQRRVNTTSKAGGLNTDTIVDYKLHDEIKKTKFIHNTVLKTPFIIVTP